MCCNAILVGQKKLGAVKAKLFLFKNMFKFYPLGCKSLLQGPDFIKFHMPAIIFQWPPYGTYYGHTIIIMYSFMMV